MFRASDVENGGGAIGFNENVVDEEQSVVAVVLGHKADAVKALALVQRHMQILCGALLPACMRFHEAHSCTHKLITTAISHRGE